MRNLDNTPDPNYLTMNLVLIISLAVLLICIILIASQIRQFFGLKHKLSKANYDTYITVLGKQAQSRPIDSKTRRYKWLKGIFEIKATFDEAGKPVGEAIIKRRVWRLHKRRLT